MKSPYQNYKVTITEILQIEVEITANSKKNAEHLAEEYWKKGDYILDADNFKGVHFKGNLIKRERTKER